MKHPKALTGAIIIVAFLTIAASPIASFTFWNGLYVRVAGFFADGNPVAAFSDVQSLPNETDSDVAKAALYALANSTDAESVGDLATFAGNRYPLEVRKAAVYAIGNVGGDEAQRILVGVVQNADEVELAKAAVYALANTLHTGQSGLLAEIVDSPVRTEIRKAAVYQIANVGGDDAVDALGRIIQSDSPTELRKPIAPDAIGLLKARAYVRC